MECEKTSFLRLQEYGDKNQREVTIGLPKKIVVVEDTVSGVAQLVIVPRNEKELDLFKSDTGLIYLFMTNDPYASCESPIVNIGYYWIQIQITKGQCEVAHDHISFVTKDIADFKIGFSAPLKSVTHMHEQPIWITEWKSGENDPKYAQTYQVMDMRFGQSTDEDVEIRHYTWLRDAQLGTIAHYLTNFQSIQNGHTLIHLEDVADKDAGLKRFMELK